MQATINLYDKYKNTQWQQLWADDHVAYIIYKVGKHYNIQMDDGINEHEEDGFTLHQAFERWNQLINNHLEYDKA